VLKLGATSADNAYGVGIPVYASPEPSGARIKIRGVTLRLSFLKQTVSK
jgi:hypothetical protein